MVEQHCTAMASRDVIAVGWADGGCRVTDWSAGIVLMMGVLFAANFCVDRFPHQFT